jgi:hypothetical protein
MKMEVSDLTVFHPQWLHFRLSDNPEYRTRFADRAWKHLSDGGTLSPEKSLERINKRINEVDVAVVAESARWGDSNRTGAPYTKNNNWMPEVNKIRNNYIPYRTKVLIGQLKRADLFPSVNAPVIKMKSGASIPENVVLTSPLTIEIENPNTSGTIYYTLNGSDPRKSGGGVNTGVSFSLNTISLNIEASTQIKTRILSDGKWSAVQQVNLINQQEDYSDLKITEVHYHPPDYITGSDTIEGKDLEFIEFKNSGNNSINLGGLVLDSAVHYTFPDSILLPPGKFYVVVSKPSKFYAYYGLEASGNFEGNLANSGEEILLSKPFQKDVINFSYQDSSPWPTVADGEGFTLSSAEINPSGDPGDYSYWTMSVKKDGTPFADNILTDDGSAPDDNGSLFAYPNPTQGFITIQLITDEETTDMDLMIFTITGRLVKHTKIGNPGLFDLATSGLPAGVYIIKVTSLKYSSRTLVILTK